MLDELGVHSSSWLCKHPDGPSALERASEKEDSFLRCSAGIKARFQIVGQTRGALIGVLLGASDGDTEIGQLRGLAPAGSRARRQLDVLLREVDKAMERHVLDSMVIRWIRPRPRTRGCIQMEV